MKLFILFLFATLAVTGALSETTTEEPRSSSEGTTSTTKNSTLTCDCSSKDEKLCFSNHTCNAGKGECIIIAFNNTIQRKEMGSSHLYQGCEQESHGFDQCKENTMFLTAGEDFYLYSETKCCHEDNCNKAFELPVVTNKNNNLECLSCFAITPKLCKPVMTKCFETQDQCVNITGKFIKGTEKSAFTLKGCATSSTASVLQEKDIKLNFGDFYYTINGKVSSIQAPQGIVFAVLLPSLLGLLLLDKCLY